MAESKNSYIKLSVFKPNRILELPIDRREMFLGTVIGNASLIIKRSMPNDMVISGANGIFEARLSDSNEVIVSRTIFMADKFIKPIIALLTTGKNVIFAYEVYTHRDSNDILSWVLLPILAPKTVEDDSPLSIPRGML